MKRFFLTRAALAVGAAVVFFLAALVLTTVLLVRENYQTAMDDSEAQAQRFVAGAEAAVNRSLLGIDVLLASLDNLLDLSLLQREWIDDAQASKLIQGALRQNLLVRNVALLDDQENTIASSNARGAALQLQLPQGFLEEMLEQPVSTLSISEPVVSFNSSEPVLYFGRHIRLADGSKVLAVAEVQVALLASILVQGVDIMGLEASFERDNGQLLASVPALDVLSGKMLSPALGLHAAAAQTTPSAARLSGVPALVVQRNLLYPNALITASIPMASVLDDWRRNSWQIGGVATAFGLLILLAGSFSLWYLHRMALAQATIVESKATLDQALESMVSGFLLLDAQHRLLSWNRRYIDTFPWIAPVLAHGMPFRTLMEANARFTKPNATDAERGAWVEHRLSLLDHPEGSHEQVQPDGRIVEITERTTPTGGVVIVYEDVTSLRRSSEEIEQLAFYDPLTGLPNRRLLADRLQQAVHTSLRTGRRGALLFLDLDHFKTLNDTQGHDVGDQLLRQVAQRLQTCVRDTDTVARLGGDEFVVMLQDLSPHTAEAALQVKLVGDNLLATLNKPYDLGHTDYRTSGSVGATLFGDSLVPSAELLKQADIAMYQVKNAGRNALCFFDPHMLAAIEVRADIERDLRQAVNAHQLELHYQLQVNSRGQAVGAEALVRWQHPVRGMVSPVEFIRVAEETGLIVPLGEFVLRSACEQLALWDRHPNRELLEMSVNVSARQFRQTDFVEQVRSTLRDTGANPRRLKLELTESLVLDNVDNTIATMHALKELGLRFAIDDFGTGQSSLTYLTQLPLDQIKIDQSFIRNLGERVANAVMVQTIIGMANTLGLEVIAEGVETAAQRDFLATHGCQLYQGYLFAKPLAADGFETLLVQYQKSV
ncbi:MAG: EAL domain-containing protein [Rhodoferax sp.]|nr:EAL domain-containing protein [Rhodoferax sp.]